MKEFLVSFVWGTEGKQNVLHPCGFGRKVAFEWLFRAKIAYYFMFCLSCSCLAVPRIKEMVLAVRK